MTDKKEPREVIPRPMASNGSFTFAVSKGNYPGKIKEALMARGNWTEVKEDIAIQ